MSGQDCEYCPKRARWKVLGENRLAQYNPLVEKHISEYSCDNHLPRVMERMCAISAESGICKVQRIPR